MSQRLPPNRRRDEEPTDTDEIKLEIYDEDEHGQIDDVERRNRR